MTFGPFTVYKTPSPDIVAVFSTRDKLEYIIERFKLGVIIRGNSIELKRTTFATIAMDMVHNL